jgi:hypothetical protein
VCIFQVNISGTMCHSSIACREWLRVRETYFRGLTFCIIALLRDLLRWFLHFLTNYGKSYIFHSARPNFRFMVTFPDSARPMNVSTDVNVISFESHCRNLCAFIVFRCE